MQNHNREIVEKIVTLEKGIEKGSSNSSKEHFKL